MISSENTTRQPALSSSKVLTDEPSVTDEAFCEYSDPDLEDYSDENADACCHDCMSAVQPIIYEISLAEESSTRKSISLFYDTQQEVLPKYRDASLRWLMKINDYFEMPTDCLYLAGIYFDIVLCTIPVKKAELQLVASVCYWISTKLECRNQPSVEDFNTVSCTKFTLQEFIQMEQRIFVALNHKLSYPTSKMFLRHYVTSTKSPMDLINLSNTLCETCFPKFEFFGIKHSIIAKACVLVAAAALNADAVAQALQKEECDEDSLRDCCQKIVKISEEKQICHVKNQFK